MAHSSHPTVSVVIPAYNAEVYVKEAVTSVLRQSYPLEEIVVVDDGSTDGTLQALRELEAANPDRVLVMSGPNKGGSAARNRGMAAATGEYIEFLDADDLLFPEKIERDVAMLSERPALLFGLHEGYHGSEKVFEASGFPSPDPWVCFVSNKFGHTSANLFRRDAVVKAGRWDETRPFAQEYDLIARMLMNEPHVMFGTHRSTQVRRVPGSVSYTFTPAMREARIDIDVTVLQHLRALGDRPQAVAAAETSLFLQLRQLYTLLPDRAVELHARIFGTDYAPPANGSNTALYRTAYRCLGFAGAEALKSTLDRVRNLVRS